MTTSQNFAHCTVGLHSTVQSARQARRKHKKFGGASSNVVIIIYLHCWNRVKWLICRKLGVPGHPWHPWHPRIRRPLWCVGFSFTLYTNILYFGVHRMVCILLLDENIVAVAMSKNSFFKGWQKAYFYTRKNVKVHLHPLFYYPNFSVRKQNR